MANWALLPGVGISAGTSAVFFGDSRDAVRRAIGDDLLGEGRSHGRYDRHRDGVLRYDDEDRLDWVELRSGSLRCEDIDLLRDSFENVARFCGVRDGRSAVWRQGINLASSIELGICFGGVHQRRADPDPDVGWIGVGADPKEFGEVSLHVETFPDGETIRESVPSLLMGGGEYRLTATPAIAHGYAKSDIVSVRGDDSPALVTVHGEFFGVQVCGNGLRDAVVLKSVETTLLDFARASVDDVETGADVAYVSGSIPVDVEPDRLEPVLDELVSAHELEWYLTNVYAADGVTELGWWHE